MAILLAHTRSGVRGIEMNNATNAASGDVCRRVSRATPRQQKGALAIDYVVSNALMSLLILHFARMLPAELESLLRPLFRVFH